ncbi:helix-turn-helix domain-containing protein [Effusibacillus pohliae]|uniref:helix-turn-helix domain-containing protein n=1 Tax=Effusibacillus pohliae TaxID=232270 RepID=UPI00037A4B86|nr:helix-turn-helix domain-containing protein [Effusibacillus pohliae]
MFGERLRQLRKQKNLTMKEFGKKFGLAESTISGYENGTRTPDLETIEKFADFFGVTVDYLVKGRTEPPKEGQVPDISPEEREFLNWVKENLESAFFYDFHKSPEEQKEEMMRGLRLIWELEKNRKPGQKQGE